MLGARLDQFEQAHTGIGQRRHCHVRSVQRIAAFGQFRIERFDSSGEFDACFTSVR